MTRVAALVTAFFLALTAQAPAQDYPNKPIHVITTSSAGGISDIFMFEWIRRNSCAFRSANNAARTNVQSDTVRMLA